MLFFAFDLTSLNLLLFNSSYLDRKKVIGGDEAAYEYRWGPRAEKELTKRQVLQFVSEVCEKGTVSWVV